MEIQEDNFKTESDGRPKTSNDIIAEDGREWFIFE